MKKTIAILLVLVLAGAGLFAATPTSTESASIDIITKIKAYSLFGVSAAEIGVEGNHENAFNSVALFQNAALANVDYTTTEENDMYEFITAKTVGYLSGINNSKTTAIVLKLTTTSFSSGSADPIPLEVVDPTDTDDLKIPVATNKFGTLKNTPIQVRVPADSLSLIDTAPASDDWKATVTISIATT